MPMHVIVSETGHIRHAAPTLAKLLPGGGLVGRRFLEVIELRRPRNIYSMEDLRSAVEAPLHLRFRGALQTTFRGIAVPLAAGEGLLINLSFGIAVADAVRFANAAAARCCTFRGGVAARSTFADVLGFMKKESEDV